MRGDPPGPAREGSHFTLNDLQGGIPADCRVPRLVLRHVHRLLRLVVQYNVSTWLHLPTTPAAVARPRHGAVPQEYSR
ncbi:putative MarR family transcriptional regulator [Streptomyces sp. Tu6071]|nr:putative MarR family transcriptional regulator [Streptomyces sp. Tu6071]